MLWLSLFGALAVSLHEADGACHEVPLSVRPGMLLAFLALSRGRSYSRGELTATLWGERAAAPGAGTFNTTLWRLRKAIERPPFKHGDLIACDRRGALGLPERAPLRLDVDEFTHLVAPALAKPLAAMDDADVEALRGGVGLYVGDVLTGFSDDWALREREKHRRLQLNALGRLMQISSLARDAAGGIRYAQAILDLDALREDVHRELIRFYLLAGQRAMALRQYETCRAALKAELAIHPMRETVEMYRRIADSAVGVTPEPMPESATAFVSIAALSGAASLDPAELIASARRHIAAADSQLQLTLPFVLPPKPGH